MMRPTLEPRPDCVGELEEAANRSVRRRVDRGLRGRTDGLAEHRPEADLLRTPYVGAKAITHHERFVRSDAGDLEGTLEHRRVRLAPADAVRARDAVDHIAEPEAPPVLTDLVVAAPEGVGHEHDLQSVALAPPERLGRADGKPADRVERHAAESAHGLDVDLGHRDVLTAQPHVDDRVGLLPPGHIVIFGIVARIEERVVPLALAVPADEGFALCRPVVRIPPLDEGIADVEERGTDTHPDIVSTMLDFDQLAFIERWRQRASRGVVIALDGTRGDIVVTIRSGELGERLDLRGRDATGAVRKGRLAIGDRVTMAIEYSAKDVSAGSGSSVTGDLVAPGSVVEGTVSATGEITVVDCGAALLVKGDTLPATVGDVVRFTIADEGRAYLIPTR